MTHLLPGGAVHRVHRARSPVPRWLPLFATPRSVHHLAAVAAGAYPPRRPPNAWSPRVPAPPGPCGQWDPDALAWRLPSRGACAWRSVPLLPWRVQCPGRVLTALAAGLGGVGAGAGRCAFPVSPFPPRVSRAVCGGPPRAGVPYPRSLVRHSVRSVRSAASVRLPFWFSPRVLCVCVRSRSRGVRAPPPSPGWCGTRTSRGPDAGRW